MKEENPLGTLSEIRDLMERSSRFLSLSGLSGVFAGLTALIGAGAAYIKMSGALLPRTEMKDDYSFKTALYQFLLADALIVLLVAFCGAYYFSWRKARKSGLVFLDATAKKVFIQLLVPLLSGAVFCAGLISQSAEVLVAPATLVFYGMALINASKYTFREIYFLGLSEILLGLVACFGIGYGLYFWAFGFGVLHIVYGTFMYIKYER